MYICINLGDKITNFLNLSQAFSLKICGYLLIPVFLRGLTVRVQLGAKKNYPSSRRIIFLTLNLIP
jgi:hypothetical protein